MTVLARPCTRTDLIAAAITAELERRRAELDTYPAGYIDRVEVHVRLDARTGTPYSLVVRIDSQNILPKAGRAA